MKRLLVALACSLALVSVATIARAQQASITLDWTSPGDDANVGTATSYEMRWSLTAPDTTSATAFQVWLNGSTPVTGLPAPQVAGTAQTVTVTKTGGWQPGPVYWRMRTVDEVGNWSEWSNVAIKIVPNTTADVTAPAKITNYRTR